MCDLCKIDYGSCQLFKDYTQGLHRLNKVSLRSNYDDYRVSDESDKDASNEFLEVGSIWAIQLLNHQSIQFGLLKLSMSLSFQKKHLMIMIPNPGVPGPKPVGGSKVNSAFHPSKVDQMSTRTSRGISAKK